MTYTDYNIKKILTLPMKNDETLVLVDEIGDHSKRPVKGSSKVFGFGVSIVTKPNSFAEVSGSYKELKGISRELKARKIKTPDDKDIVAGGIKESGARTYGMFVDKTKDVPEGWTDQSGEDVQIGMLYETLNIVISHIISDKIIVIVDKNKAYNERDERERNIVEAMSEPLSRDHRKNVDCMTSGIRTGIYKSHMETNDIVAHALFESAEQDDHRLSEKAGMELIRFGSNDSVRKRQWFVRAD